MADTALPRLTPIAWTRSAVSRARRAGRAAYARRRHARWTSIAAVAAGAIALLVLAGWAFDVPFLRTPRADWPNAKPNTAVALLASAGALWLLRVDGASPHRVALGRALAALAASIGGLTLLEELYQFDLHIDGMLFEEAPGAPWTASPGRMAPSVAASLVLLGFSLLFLETETRGGRWPSEFPALAVLLITVPRLVGYVYGTVPHVRTPHAVMAAYTAVALALLATGTLAARSGRGLVAILASRTVGGRAARRLVPAAALVPLVIGAVAVAAGAEGVIELPLVAPIAISGVIIAFVAVGLWSGWAARSAESEREATMQRLQAQHAATRALVDSATVAEASPRFLEAVGQSLGWDLAALWQVAREDGVLECAHAWRRPELAMSAFQESTQRLRLAPGVELPGLVWMSGEPAWVPDILRSPSLRGVAAARDGVRAGFAFPVRYGAEIRGVIELFSRTPRDPDRDMIAMAPLLGSQIGEALERKRAEELLRASEDRFRAVADTASDALVTVDGAGTITYVNHAAERMFGHRAATLLGKPVSLVLPNVREIDDLLMGRTMERMGRRRDGTELPVELSASRWSTAEGVFCTAIIRDIGARKRAEEELRQARDAAEASSRELEAFSYSVSHDLRTPVRSIDGFSQALLEDMGDRLGEEGRENLLRVRAAADRMSHLIDDLLELSRTSRAALHRQAVDLSAMAREIAEELRSRAPERRAELVIAERIGAWGDARLLRVVLQNLLENAWKFTARQPVARIEVGVMPGSAPPIYFVRDNGIGFDMAYREKLFIPFQRLHDEADVPGSGVGLALVERIILRHGGRIWAESATGRGATFHFTLPGVPGVPAAVESA